MYFFLDFDGTALNCDFYLQDSILFQFWFPGL